MVSKYILSQKLNLLSLSQVLGELKQEGKGCAYLYWCNGQTGIKNKDNNNQLRNLLVMKGNILPITWKAFRDNQERYS